MTKLINYLSITLILCLMSYCIEAAEVENNNISTEHSTTPYLNLPSIMEDSKQSLNIQDKDFVMGNTESNVMIVEYFSPTCPHCFHYQTKIFPELQKKYIDTGKISYVTREFIGNKQDLDASILARCNGSIESYHNFMKVILDQQDQWAFSKNYREILTNIGTLGGVSPEQYAACLNDSAKIQFLIDNNKFLMQEPNFIGTPTFFINGKHYTKPYTLEDLSEAIDAAIARYGK